jgi:hypothetical protein
MAGPVRPPPLLYAGDRDRNFHAPCDHDADVEDAVLLGADQLIAIHQQDLPSRPVLEREFGDAAARGHLGNLRKLAIERVVEQQVGGRRAVPGREREQREVLMNLRRAECKSLKRFTNDLHAGTPPVEALSMRRVMAQGASQAAPGLSRVPVRIAAVTTV